jgi:hypothetical protein
MTDKELQHYGILGMKWGVRRSQAQLDRAGGRTKKRRAEAHEDSKTAKALKKRKLRTLSNAEIRKLNERLQLERQYRELTKRKAAVGKKTANKILSRIGNRIVDKTIDKGMDLTVNRILGK